MFLVESTQEYGTGDCDLRFVRAGVDEAAGLIEDLTGISFDAILADLTTDSKLTYGDDGYVVTVERVGALV